MPDAAPPSRPLRIALVLGSGGIVGGAYHAGVIKALRDTWDIDARQVELVVGTSAGALTGALTVAGLDPDDLFRRETHKPLSDHGAALLARGRAKIGRQPRPWGTLGLPAAPEAVWNALRSPQGVALGSVAAALLPRGRVPTTAVAGMTEGLFGDTWPTSPRFRVVGVELRTARRVVFAADDDVDDLDGRARRRHATPAQAVAASCAVPGVFRPATIAGRDYLDGGVHSADALDLVGTTRFDLVVVSSPMSSRHHFAGNMAMVGLREASRRQTDRERQSLPASTRVVIVRPNPEDLDAMGSNMLDPARRPAVAFQAHASASALFGSLPHPCHDTP